MRIFLLILILAAGAQAQTLTRGGSAADGLRVRTSQSLSPTERTTALANLGLSPVQVGAGEVYGSPDGITFGGLSYSDVVRAGLPVGSSTNNYLKWDNTASNWVAGAATETSYAPSILSGSTIDWSAVPGNGTLKLSLTSNTTLSHVNAGVSANNGKRIFLYVSNQSTWTLAWNNTDFGTGGAPTQSTGGKADIYALHNIDGTVVGSRLTAGYTADTQAPTISSAQVNSLGTALTMNFSEPVQATDWTGFLASMSGGSITPTGPPTGSGTSALVWALPRQIESTESGTLSYSRPTGGIVDSANNSIANFTGFSITNGSTYSASIYQMLFEASTQSGWTTNTVAGASVTLNYNPALVGSGSLRILAAGNSSDVGAEFAPSPNNIPGPGNVWWWRRILRIDTLPSTTITILADRLSGTLDQRRIRLTAAGVLSATDGANANGTGTFTPSASSGIILYLWGRVNADQSMDVFVSETKTQPGSYQLRVTAATNAGQTSKVYFVGRNSVQLRWDNSEVFSGNPGNFP